MQENKKKRTMILYYLQLEYGLLFIDKDCTYIAYRHENDFTYRQEYMEFIPAFFGGEIIELIVPDGMSEDEDKDYIELEEQLKIYKSQLQEQMNK